MNKKYEQMATFNMSMVRYYADKCGTIGLFDNFDKACDWFEKHCIIKTKEIDVFHKLKEMKKDFE